MLPLGIHCGVAAIRGDRRLVINAETMGHLEANLYRSQGVMAPILCFVAQNRIHEEDKKVSTERQKSEDVPSRLPCSA